MRPVYYAKLNHLPSWLDCVIYLLLSKREVSYRFFIVIDINELWYLKYLLVVGWYRWGGEAYIFPSELITEDDLQMAHSTASISLRYSF